MRIPRLDNEGGPDFNDAGPETKRKRKCKLRISAGKRKGVTAWFYPLLGARTLHETRLRVLRKRHAGISKTLDAEVMGVRRWKACGGSHKGILRPRKNGDSSIAVADFHPEGRDEAKKKYGRVTLGDKGGSNGGRPSSSLIKAGKKWGAWVKGITTFRWLPDVEGEGWGGPAWVGVK